MFATLLYPSLLSDETFLGEDPHILPQLPPDTPSKHIKMWIHPKVCQIKFSGQVPLPNHCGHFTYLVLTNLRTTDFVAKWILFFDHRPHLQTQAAWSQMQTGLWRNSLGMWMDHKGRSIRTACWLKCWAWRGIHFFVLWATWVLGLKATYSLVLSNAALKFCLICMVKQLLFSSLFDKNQVSILLEPMFQREEQRKKIYSTGPLL